MTMTLTTSRTADERRDALAARLFEATLGSFELLSVYLGDRLGLYAALRANGPSTAGELATAARIDPRYAREWLEQQAVASFLDVDSADAAPDVRRYSLPDGHAEVVLEPDDVALMAPMARFVVGAAQAMPLLFAAYRSGDGVAWSDYGHDVVEAQSAINRPQFGTHVASSWIPAMPDIDERLRTVPGSRVADVGCGTGWSTIAIARGYPATLVDGLDLDAGSIARAQETLAEIGDELADRVTFAARDAADPALAGRYDLVTIFEALHDMSQPVAVLRAVRDLLAPGGAVLVADEKVAESFTAPGDEIERLMYGYSIVMCLPNGLADRPSVGTGTVLRPAAVEAMASEAGFARVTVLPIDHDTFRFYRLDP
jgi:2-polyprenyl-3-methyl-5-hydroxy-6-metoxy-1,4-benzoquinol methylase